MSDIVDLFDHPPVHDPVLVLGLPGWIDAGNAAGQAMAAILDSGESELVASYDTDVLLDYRARRPLMNLVEGRIDSLNWPAVELRALVDAAGLHVLVLHGAEPDHAWGAFTASVVDLAADLGARMVVGLGAYPAPVPHTRGTNLALTSPSEELLDSFPGFVRGTVEVPAGVQTAIEVAASEAGIPSLGLWAQVPHYISGLNYPAAAISLIDGLSRVAGIALGTGSLEGDAASTRRQIDELVAANGQHGSMIRQLEELWDSSEESALGPLPTGDELAAELQAFLRDQPDEN